MPPIKEYRIGAADVDFGQEMKALVAEDLATHRQDVAERIRQRGESAAAFGRKQPEAVESMLTAGFEEDSSVDMHQVLAQQMGMEYVSLEDYPVVDFRVLRMVTADQAKALRIFPLAYDSEDNVLQMAIADPSDPTIVDDLSLALGCTIDPVVAAEEDILDRINQYYGMGEETLEGLIEELSAEGDENVLTSLAGHVVDLSDLDSAVNAPPIVKLANLILLKAVEDRASDIHIEPFENLLRIRYRVDGVLREMDSPPRSMQLGLISRLKVLANLDIAEQRRPQDGRINLSMSENREVELRVTAVPTVHGETIVMRVLDKALMQMGIHQIGMPQDILEDFLKQVRKPNGIVLVTGPTGCGKTTTLYSAIGEVRSVEEKFITTEDPVEYQMDGIVQVNINEGVGLTYARCLRAILRQDPDRILVGEIRDLPTAQISVQAALTGHLVFSTLHTNSAAGTVTRLIDMGVEPFLITSTLQAVVGQRLVRTICPSCREAYTPQRRGTGRVQHESRGTGRHDLLSRRGLRGVRFHRLPRPNRYLRVPADYRGDLRSGAGTGHDRRYPRHGAQAGHEESAPRWLAEDLHGPDHFPGSGPSRTPGGGHGRFVLHPGR